MQIDLHEDQIVCCPNCGGAAKRHCVLSSVSGLSDCPEHFLCRTECEACDYLMTVCILENEIINVYSPEISTLVQASA